MKMCAGAGADSGADSGDGLFDITVVGDCSRTTLLTVFPKVSKGTQLDQPKVAVHRAATVELVADGFTGYADDEPLGPLPLTAECVPGADRAAVP